MRPSPPDKLLGHYNVVVTPAASVALLSSPMFSPEPVSLPR